ANKDKPLVFNGFVGDGGRMQKLLERNVGQRPPRREHLLGALGGDPRKTVTRARRRGLGQEIAQPVEDVGGAINSSTICHGGSGRRRWARRQCKDYRPIIS